LFIDDLKGRRLAEHYMIETTTTLGIIFELLLTRAITRIDYLKNVKNYGGQGWISGEILEEFIERGREID
jgi:predicted nucleic acid-binding protein